MADIKSILLPDGTEYAIRDNSKVAKAGDTMTGDLTMAGYDVILGTNSSSSNDSGDIVFQYGNGNEKARIWMPDTITAKTAPSYRVFNSSGTNLYNGKLVAEYVDSGTITSWSNNKVSGGSLTGYIFGKFVVIKISNVTITNASGRQNFCTLGANFRPIAQMTSGTIVTSSGAKLYFGVNTDGSTWFDASTTLTWTAYVNFAYVRA